VDIVQVIQTPLGDDHFDAGIGAIFDGIKWLVALSLHHVAFLPLSARFPPSLLVPLVLRSLTQRVQPLKFSSSLLP
jgi:hypothetical protein